MSRRALLTLVALVAVGAGTGPAGAEASPAGVRTSTVGGGWAQVVNCVFTHYDVAGTFDPATGDMRGTLEETFVGIYVPDKSHGTL